MTKLSVNLDANASHPVLPNIWPQLAEIRPALNASSVHRAGQAARALLEESRESVRALLGLDRSWELLFTSGATEANNLAIYSPYWKWRENSSPKALHLVSSALEHPSVREPLLRLQRLGADLSIVRSPSGELPGAHDFLQALKPESALVSCILANNETGQILPVREIAQRVKELRPQILFHCDAVQALGKTQIDYSELGADLLTFSSHKIGGISGAGVLAIRDVSQLRPLLLGGPQEHRLRAGTENLCAIYSFALAAREIALGMKQRIAKMSELKNVISSELSEKIEGLVFNFEDQATLCNTLSLTVEGVNASDLVVAADLNGVLISAGSACSSGKPEPAASLLAQGFTNKQARSTIRISVSSELEASSVKQACSILADCIRRCKEQP